MSLIKENFRTLNSNIKWMDSEEEEDTEEWWMGEEDLKILDLQTEVAITISLTREENKDILIMEIWGESFKVLEEEEEGDIKEVVEEVDKLDINKKETGKMMKDPHLNCQGMINKKMWIREMETLKRMGRGKKGMKIQSILMGEVNWGNKKWKKVSRNE